MHYMTKKILLSLVGLNVVFLIIFCSFIFFHKNNFSEKKVHTHKNTSHMGPSLKEYSFAEFVDDKTQFQPQLPEYTIASNELSNLKDFENSIKKNFTPEQIATLEKDHFFITKNDDQFYQSDPSKEDARSDDWTSLYKNIGGDAWKQFRKPENAVFVTSDFLLHTYHRLLEKEFEYIEFMEFYPRIQEISQSMLMEAVKEYESAKDEKQKESFERLIAYFAVPTSILNVVEDDFIQASGNDSQLDDIKKVEAELNELKSQIPANAFKWASEEIHAVYEAKEMKFSPIFGLFLESEGLQSLSDYTQYQPRSHYNKNAVLRAYFRSMMWYGRNNFALKSDALTRDAANITKNMQKLHLTKKWEEIYNPTTFFVGASDDLGMYEYGNAITSIGQNKRIDHKFLSQMKEILAKEDGPQIMSSVIVGDAVFSTSEEELLEQTKGFRFMGQRFTPDAFIFSSLTQGDTTPDPETGEFLPSTPTAMMFFQIMGDQTAKPIMNQWIATEAPNSKNVLANKMSHLQSTFEEVSVEQWTQNIYWSWIYTINSLLDNGTKNVEGFPMFVKNDNWKKKNLQCAASSWTELKHDTLLYAKQSYAEMGGGGPEEGEIPPVPKGYVEPNIVFFDRLIGLTKLSTEGLKNAGVLDQGMESRNKEFIKSLTFFRKIAVAQLQNEQISDKDFERLRNEAGRLSNILRPFFVNETTTENNARSALIADVHTDVPGGQILYEATGIPNYIYVAVKDTNGVRLTKGLVFSYHEFTHPIGKRLTDEVWRNWVYQEKEKVPQMDEWNKSLVK
ncbi:MAG: hypothetical protein CR972_03325 [Candidatus Moraniibacteriota bacterium]|nr:MAG: hypothetical protein CR972_03325 [Candidatus Moranbacteria bacterium]